MSPLPPPTDATLGATPTLRVRGIVKGFPGVLALRGVDLEALPGEIHALIGENGAGKSTLMRILYGVHQPDAGTIELCGERRAGRGPKSPPGPAARHLDGPPGAQSRPRPRRRSQHLPRPRAAPRPRPVVEFFPILRALRADGVAVLYISRRLEELAAVVDRVTVFRDGRHVGTVDARTTPGPRLIRLMVGRSLDQQLPKVRLPIGDEALRVEGLTRRGVTSS